jgi:hypothetical protein
MDEQRLKRDGVARELRPGRPRRFVPAAELADALAGVHDIDYERLRADIDVVFDDSPKDW